MPPNDLSTPSHPSNTGLGNPSLPHPSLGITQNVLPHIGHTPLISLTKLTREENLECTLLAKCEFFSAGGSVKDRIALRMIEEAERSGRIHPGRTTIIEPTSGNTGIGLALVAAVKGYRTIITLPEKMSQEKVSVLKALGSEIVRTPTEAAWDSPESHIGVAKRLEKEIPGAVILDQYGNENNPLAHEFGTAVEIVQQVQNSGGKVDVVVAGAGTGGTISGLAKGLKKVWPDIHVVGVDPHGSILAVPESLNTSHSQYQVEGIGYDFVPGTPDSSISLIPDVLNRSLVDTWIKTGDQESFTMSRRLIRTEGLLCGGSSGAAVVGAIKVAKQLNLGKDKTVVVVLPDSLRNYITKFLDDHWMQKYNFLPEVPDFGSEARQTKTWKEATVRDLHLPAVVSVTETSPCGEAVAKMQKGGFDQLPVVNDKGTLRGLVTLGNLLSYISSGKATAKSPVSKVMYDFSRLPSSPPDSPRLKALLSPAKPTTRPSTPGVTSGDRAKTLKKGDMFWEITMDTKLDTLNRFFFDKYPVALVTERKKEGGGLDVVGVVTKVDLLGFLVQIGGIDDTAQ